MNEVTIFGRNAGQLSAKQRVVSVSSGDRHCLIGCEKRVYSIGANDWGQLGLGHNDTKNGVNRMSELPLPENATVKEVAAGRDHSLVLLSNGEVYGCGADNEDQLGGSGGWKLAKIDFPVKIKTIDCGSSYSAGLDEEGNLYAVGSNEDGQLGLEEEAITKPTKIASSVKSFSCGYHHIAIITFDGGVLTAGDNEYGQLGREGRERGFEQVYMGDEFFVPKLVSCGGQVTFVVDENSRQVFVTGKGDRGELGLGGQITDTKGQFVKMDALGRFEHISSGFSSSSALCETTKQVFIWGSRKNNVLGDVAQNLYRPTISEQLPPCRLISSGGWFMLACHSGETIDRPKESTTNDYGARAKRRAKRALTATLPPLTRTLKTEELNELRMIVASQSLKRSAEFALCDEAEIAKHERVSSSVDTTVTKSVDVNTLAEIDEDQTESEDEIESDLEVPVDADVTVQNVNGSNTDEQTLKKDQQKPKTDKKEEVAGEISTDVPAIKTGTTKSVNIDENNNEEKVYSDWGDDKQVPVFKSFRKSVRRFFKKGDKNESTEASKETSIDESDTKSPPEKSSDSEVSADKPNIEPPSVKDPAKKSKFCTIL